MARVSKARIASAPAPDPAAPETTPARPRRARTKAAPAAVATPGLTPLDYMLQVVRDEGMDLAKRLDAAKAAAPYLHPRLTTVKVGNEDDKPFEQVIRWAVSQDEATPDPAAA